MPKLVTVDQLCISPFNVRLNAEDAEATTALEASIAARGLLLPLVVHDMAAYRQQALADEPVAAWGVLAGGRRLRAIRQLVGSGRISRDFPIEVVTRDLSPAEITELSLAENLLRRDLRPYEIYAAVARAAERGAGEAEIATNIGQRLDWVQRQLRIGRLVPAIFDAYTNGTISEDQAKAFAATEDSELQRAAWTHFGSMHHLERSATRIRAWYKIGDPALERLLRFVGDDAYRDAGGRYELDLFADGPERGRVVDDGMLREMAENRLAELRTDLRKRTGKPSLRFANEAPQHHGGTDHSLAITPGIEKRPDGKIVLPEGDIIATIDIEVSGNAQAHYWWASRKAHRDANRSTPKREVDQVVAPSASVDDAAAFEKYSDASQAARAAVRDEHSLTADGLQVVRTARREILRALLVADAFNDGAIGRDFILWSQLRQELTKLPRAEVGARTLESVFQSAEDPDPTDITGPHLEEMRAHHLWNAALQELRAQDFITIGDPADAFTAFHLAPEGVKNAAGAVLAGAALLRSCNVPGWRIAVHDRIADIIGANDLAIRDLWRPTAKFMALFSKMKRLELAQPHVDPDAFREWHKLPDPTLTGACAGAVDQVPGWVHPLLSFGVASEHDSAEQREAAE